MNRKTMMTAAGTVVLASATAAAYIGVNVGFDRTATSPQRPDAATMGGPQGAGPSRDATKSVAVGQPGDIACDMTAKPDLSGIKDARISGDAAKNGWAQAITDSSTWITRDQAGAIADKATTGVSPATAAVKVPAAMAARWFGGEESAQFINPARCVWVVTVNGDWTEDRYLAPPKTPTVFHTYTESFDAASGEGIDFIASIDGSGIPNVLTGAGLE